MSFKTKLVGGLATALAILLLVAVLSYSSLVRNSEDRRSVMHTHLVLEKLDALQIHLTDAETGERGYILTGLESYLPPYQVAYALVAQNLHSLRELTADNPVQQDSLDRLEPLARARLSELQDRISLRKKAGLAAGASAVAGGSREPIMEQIRALIAIMKQEEDRLLVQRSNELEASSRRTKSILVVGELLGLLFLSAAGLVIRQEMIHRARAEEEVRTLNRDLERRVAERTAELAERAKDLERSNMELQQFAYVASHDLQEPLRTIASFTQLLAKRYNDKLDDKAREFINYAVDGSKRMQTLINDLLSYSRVGTQGRPFAPARCDAILDRVLKNLKIGVDACGALITRDPLPVVMADEGQLAQLFQNLLTNAMKFRGADVPRIHISAARDGTAWKIMVRDNGIGISPEHSDRVFVIFQRLHTKTQYPGTGIGLAICKKIAERHGGRIWVEPSPGGGSTFCFTIGGEIKNANENDKEGYELRTSASAN
jgi:signal transduction histidine kinase